MLDQEVVSASVDAHWAAAVPVLEDYIRIPAKSPMFDPDWARTGHLAAAVALIHGWCEEHAPDDATVRVHEIDGLTPVVVIEVPATAGVDRTDTVLLYGHLDKQPEMTGWRDGLGPWTPVIENDRLYGRGGGDDGYAAFAVTSALEALRRADGSHQRCVAIIEASEESGSPDLPAHLEALSETIGDVSLVICLDSGAADYDALWVTTSLRGLISVHLRVDVLERGMHSGLVGGMAPSSVRILRQLLDRIEDPTTGRVLLESFHVDIPSGRVDEAQVAASAGVDPRDDVSFAGATRSDPTNPPQALIDTTWRPTMATIGIDGIPALADAGNVLRPHTTLGLSFRIPPTCDPDAAIAELRAVVEADPPSGAEVTLTVVESASGWNAAATEEWLGTALDEASVAHFGRIAGWWGIGGSIPFMAMLGERFPEAQFVITGVLGPESNAHGPNEFLDLPTARRVSACMAHVIDAHARR